MILKQPLQFKIKQALREESLSAFLLSKEITMLSLKDTDSVVGALKSPRDIALQDLLNHRVEQLSRTAAAT